MTTQEELDRLHELGYGRPDIPWPTGSTVIHRSEPEPMTVDVEVGVSASGKDFWTVKVRNAQNPEGAALSAKMTALELNAEMTRDKQALDWAAETLRTHEGTPLEILQEIAKIVATTGRVVEDKEEGPQP
jgi:hypothetical protein